MLTSVETTVHAYHQHQVLLIPTGVWVVVSVKGVPKSISKFQIVPCEISTRLKPKSTQVSPHERTIDMACLPRVY